MPKPSQRPLGKIINYCETSKVRAFHFMCSLRSVCFNHARVGFFLWKNADKRLVIRWRFIWMCQSVWRAFLLIVTNAWNHGKREGGRGGGVEVNERKRDKTRPINGYSRLGVAATLSVSMQKLILFAFAVFLCWMLLLVATCKLLSIEATMRHIIVDSYTIWLSGDDGHWWWWWCTGIKGVYVYVCESIAGAWSESMKAYAAHCTAHTSINSLFVISAHKD